MKRLRAGRGQGITRGTLRVTDRLGETSTLTAEELTMSLPPEY